MPEDLSEEWRRINAFGNAPGPRDWTPSVDPLAAYGGYPGGPPRRPGNRRRGLWLGATIAVVVVALVGGAVALGRHAADVVQRRHTPVIVAASGATGPAGSAVAAEPTTAVALDVRTPVGTCLAAGAPQNEKFVACSAAHRFELVSHARASGDGYPADDYWNGPVAEQCYQDMLKYVGLARDQWPAGLESSFFIPVAQGWAAGDRAVYCVAEWTKDATRSVHGLPAAPSTPSAVATGGVQLQGRLTRVPDPTGADAGCLAVEGSGGTVVVMPDTNALSWWVSLDNDGRIVDAESGILRGSDPLGKDFLVHTGASVTLSGQFIEYSGSGAYACGASRVFDYTAVG